MSAEGGAEIKMICDVTSHKCRNVRHTATKLPYSTVSYMSAGTVYNSKVGYNGFSR